MRTLDCATRIYTAGGIALECVFPDLKVLHLGCGDAKLAGAIGIDRLNLPAVDVVHDIDDIPWPFGDDSADLIYAHSVVEHLGDLPAFFDESWRVLRPGGRMVIAVPYFRSVHSFTDPTHTHFFTCFSLDYFLSIDNARANYSYSRHKFDLVGFWPGWPTDGANILKRLVKGFVRRYPAFYDQYLSLLLPVEMLVWELEKPSQRQGSGVLRIPAKWTSDSR